MSFSQCYMGAAAANRSFYVEFNTAKLLRCGFDVIHTKFKKMDLTAVRCADEVLSERESKNHGENSTFQEGQRGLGK